MTASGPRSARRRPNDRPSSCGATTAPATSTAPPSWIPDRTGGSRSRRGPALRTGGWLLEDDYVAEFRYDRHLREVRRRYRARRDAVGEALGEVGLADRVEGVAAGLHAVVRLDGAVDDVAVVEAARARGVEVVALTLTRYAVDVRAPGLVVGFGQRSPAELRRGIVILADELST